VETPAHEDPPDEGQPLAGSKVVAAALREALVQAIDERGRLLELADDDADADLAEVVRLHAERLPDSRDHVGGGNAAVAVDDVIEVPGGQPGLLGERGNERRSALQAPPVLHATALLLDSTAQDALGDVVYVDLPEVGAAVEAATPFGEVESTKSVSDVYSPVTGTIAERNPLIEDRPELVNEQPYNDGWLILVTLGAGASLDGLMDAETYRSFVEQTGS